MEFIYLKAEARETILINFAKNIYVEIANPPSYFVFGKRFINVIHTQRRGIEVYTYRYK